MLMVGETASFSKTIVESDVYLFAEITGDFNPIHMNEEEAKKSSFKSRVVHGMLTSSFISAIMGTQLPGPGTIYLEQNLKFKNPVYINETVTAKVIVDEILDKEKGIYRLETIIHNNHNEVVVEGYAIVKYCH